MYQRKILLGAEENDKDLSKARWCPNQDLKGKLKTKLHGLSPRANYTDRATAACRRSDCQFLRI
jgi:hypothetical protein